MDSAAIGWTTVVAMALIAFGYGYNTWIHAINRSIGRTPLASLFVVLGVAVTVAGAGIIVWIWYGWQMAAYHVVIDAAAFLATGVPMILGDVNRDTSGHG